MCGIFGAVFSEKTETVNVEAVLRTLYHRGPDSHGTFRSYDTVLAHTRLAILDLSEAAHQPMTSADGSCTTVFNGEIYNHHELRRGLEERGVRFRSRSDTEVIVEGYRMAGERFLEHLDGMFALAIFDQSDRRLVLMRDRTGKKPLFYSWRSRSLRFASEIRALLASGVPSEIDAQKLSLLFALGYVPAPDTLYGGIHQLPPASILSLKDGLEPVVRIYWTPRFDRTPLQVSARDARREVRRLTEAAVQRRLEADVPLGAFLSGGVDSTIVVGLMAQASAQPVKTFSIGFSGDPRFDETRFARMAAKEFATAHTEFIVEPSAVELVDQLVEVHDGPFGDASAIPTSIVARLTRQHVTVALTGDGGDELFCGYPRFLAAEAGEYVPGSVLRAAARTLARIGDSGSPRTLRRRAKRFIFTLAHDLPERMLRWQSIFVDDLQSLMQQSLSERAHSSAAADWIKGVARGCNGVSPLASALCINFKSYLPYDLLVKADRSSMLHSLELRSPFLDTALIDYVAALPDHMKRRGLTTKWILRAAFRDLIPRQIQARGKMGFGVPLGKWFRTELRDFVRDTFAPSARIYRYVRPEAVASLIREHDEGVHDHQDRIWLLLTVERWLQLLPAWSTVS